MTMRYLNTLLATALLALLLAGCGAYSVNYRSQGDERLGHDPAAARPESKRAGRLHIPPGHLPEPGYCRVWIPGVPPGRQSPQGPCRELAGRVPPGAWLLSRPDRDPDYVDVSVYHQKKAGVVVEVNLYVAATGEYVRTISSR